jgi:hypothetical protein
MAGLFGETEIIMRQSTQTLAIPDVCTDFSRKALGFTYRLKEKLP